MTQTFKTWFVSLIMTTAAVWLCVLWLDRPIAHRINDVFGEWRIPAELIDSPFSSTSAISACTFAVWGLFAIMGRRFSKVETTIALCAVSTLAANLIKDLLKFVFGRTWLDTWGIGIQSFLRNGVYGFHYFHSGRSFESFPSGHAAVAAAILSVPWILFPKLRILCTICVIVVDAGLVALNLHFVSDVIAGSFVDYSTGLFTIAMWRASASELVGKITL
ncbi:MAG: phosphatase PAP2 family protein [Candidatus Acidiferrales bacterium]